MRGEGNSLGWIIVLIHLILGAYFINLTFLFVEVPEFILDINKWIFLVAGVFLVWGAINYKRAANKI